MKCKEEYPDKRIKPEKDYQFKGKGGVTERKVKKDFCTTQRESRARRRRLGKPG